MPDGSEEGQVASPVVVTKDISPTPKDQKAKGNALLDRPDNGLQLELDRLRSDPNYVATVADVERRAQEIAEQAFAEETRPSPSKGKIASEVSRGGDLTRRSFLKKVTGAIVGGAVGIEAVRNRNSILSLLTGDDGKESSRHLSHSVEQANKVFREHVVMQSEPVFWERYSAIPSNELSKFFESPPFGRAENGDFAVNYYANGVKEGSPNVSMSQLGLPDGFTSWRIIQQVGESGSVADSNPNSDRVPFSLEQLQAKYSERFVEPELIKGLPWKLNHDRTGASRSVSLGDKQNTRIIEQLDNKGRLQFFYEFR